MVCSLAHVLLYHFVGGLRTDPGSALCRLAQRTISGPITRARHYDCPLSIANTILLRLDLLDAPKAWLSDTFWTMNIIILADAWKTVPNMTLLLLAGLQPISHDLYEAAEVDGATRWQKLR